MFPDPALSTDGAASGCILYIVEASDMTNYLSMSSRRPEFILATTPRQCRKSLEKCCLYLTLDLPVNRPGIYLTLQSLIVNPYDSHVVFPNRRHSLALALHDTQYKLNFEDYAYPIGQIPTSRAPWFHFTSSSLAPTR